MRNYQMILLAALQRHHWSLEETRQPEHWWAAEVWVIASTRQQFGLGLFVTFVVDPSSGRANNLAAVRDILITREPLPDYHAVGALVSLRPHSRSYPAEVEAAMIRLEEIRSRNHAA